MYGDEVIITNNKCPECGGDLIKQGSLYFCSNYPNLHKYIRGEDGRFYKYNGDEVLNIEEYEHHPEEKKPIPEDIEEGKPENSESYVRRDHILKLIAMFILIIIAQILIYVNELPKGLYVMYVSFFTGYLISWLYYFYTHDYAKRVSV